MLKTVRYIKYRPTFFSVFLTNNYCPSDIIFLFVQRPDVSVCNPSKLCLNKCYKYAGTLRDNSCCQDGRPPAIREIIIWST